MVRVKSKICFCDLAVRTKEGPKVEARYIACADCLPCVPGEYLISISCRAGARGTGTSRGDMKEPAED